MPVTEEIMNHLARTACLPLMLVIMFSLFQYLFLTYYRRRREPLGMVLLLCAFVGFAALIPLDHWDWDVVDHLNDISEACSTLTFLLQITIIGRDGNKKIKIRALQWLTVLSELLVVVDLTMVAVSVVGLANPDIDLSVIQSFSNIIESITLLFIFCFRFIYITMIKGIKDIVRNRKLEVLFYGLFLTHEAPFMALEQATGVSWEYVQGLYHRVLIVLCVGVTLKDKLKKGRWNAFTTTATNGGTSSGNQSTASDAERGGGAGSGGPAMSVAKLGPSKFNAVIPFSVSRGRERSDAD